ncbi:MAG: hypothetical protein SFX73_06155 [Kofleriaceae bacterium]|nr:hypothetical protein [Kofleriaceae bacterium]
MWLRRRRILAIATALLWLVAIEVLPGLHLAEHADDHTHARDGSIHRVAHADAHAHGGTRHRHRRPYPVPPSLREDEPDDTVNAHASPGSASRRDLALTRRRGPNQLAIDDALVSHAAFGVAHHALATLDPPAPALTPVSAPVATVWMHTIDATLVIARPPARPNARGPPRG